MQLYTERIGAQTSAQVLRITLRNMKNDKSPASRGVAVAIPVPIISIGLDVRLPGHALNSQR